jgi:phospholipase/lecithinase/hemolysin
MLNMIRKGLLASVIGIGFIATTSHAALEIPNPAYSGLVIFGDSISDTGNVLSLTTAFGQPAFPSYPGAAGFFSNGPAWTTYLAAGLGRTGTAAPSNLLFDGTSVIPIGVQGGQNYSYGGARTGLGGSAGETTGLLGQLVAWDNSPSILGGGPLTRDADPNALYVVMAGANDLRDYRSGVAGAADPGSVAGNVVGALSLLANAGARHFLISSLPDLGLTPEAVGLGLVTESRAATLAFNGALSSLSGSFEAGFNLANGVDLDIRTLDFYGLFNRVVDDAKNNKGLTYGITNVTSACIKPGVVSGQYFFGDATGLACDVAAFSDPLHPSAASHALLGALAVQTALAPVPEPSEYAMMIAGLLVVVGMRRRARDAT